jgi:hypothetical protein
MTERHHRVKQPPPLRNYWPNWPQSSKSRPPSYRQAEREALLRKARLANTGAHIQRLAAVNGIAAAQVATESHKRENLQPCAR